MENVRKTFSRIISFTCILSLLLMMTGISTNALGNASISYDFAVEKAGYAQGTITFTSDAQGTYALYWADGQGSILQGYYPIDTLKMSAGETKSIKMGNHTAIPANAEQIVAVTGDNNEQKAVYEIPQSKQLSAVSGTKLYSFSAYSDIHIDKGGVWYVDADKHLKEGLQYAVDRNSDYLVVSGDVVTNDSGPDKEWIAYEKMLSQSDFVNPVWESNGNHDMRQEVNSGNKSFIKHSGTDSVKGSDKTYFYKIEEKTGDIFIFMSLEFNKNPHDAAEFSSEQLAWAENLIQEYTAKNVNVFLVQHSPIEGFGAGDRMSDPYYKALLNTKFEANAKFKTMIQTYPNVVWLSGHTHEDFEMDYNYSNENNTACHMIHIPSLAGSTKANSTDDDLERNGGKGFNSQGYYTEVYQNEIVFYGVNLSDQLIYPKYSYIMESTRTAQSALPEPPEKPALTGKDVDISEELSKVSNILSKYYTYSSYDQYQALKKLYYQYKNFTNADESVLSEFEEKINALSEHTGTINVYSVGDTYYFENNKSWSKVYGYAWDGDGSRKNAEWPGVKLNKAGQINGNDVYVIKFDSAGQYHNLIFTDGSSQTVDIGLYDYSGNCFKLGGTTNGKYNVSNYTANFSGEIPEPIPVVTNHEYILLYYITNEHGWEDTDSLFTRNADGKYIYTLKSKGSENISFSLYDNTDKVYQSMATSTGVVYKDGEQFDYTLQEQTTRGKSITVNGLSENSVINVVYNPENNAVSVICGEIPEQDPLANISSISSENIKFGDKITVTGAATGGSGSYQYEVTYKKTTDSKWATKQAYSTNNTVSIKPGAATEYTVKIRVKDSEGTVAGKNFTVIVTPALANTSTIDKTSITLGDKVTVTGAATGGSGTYTYQVIYKKTIDSSWATKQAYGTNNTVSIKPGAATEYTIKVRVKDSAGTVAGKSFTVMVAPALVNTSTIDKTSIAFGDKVTVTGAATGGSGSYTYEVLYKKTTDSKWASKQINGTNNTASIKPGAKATYTVKVRVKDSNGMIVGKDFTVKVN